MKEWIKRLALLGATLVVIGLLCDLLYRRIVEPEPVVPTRLGIYDDSLGWAMRPNAEASSNATGKKVVYTINSAGQRDDEVTLEKPPGTFRLVFLGDSRTFGYGVPIDQHFTRLIEGYFDKVESINLGVSGYGVDQELLALRRRGFQYQPDLVLAYVAHFGDHRHIHRERFGKPKPIFEVSGDSVVVANVPVPDRFAGLDFAHRVDLALTERSPLYRDLSKTAVRMIKAVLGRTPPPAAEPTTPADTVTLQNRLYDVALAIIRQMDRESRRAGARFVLVTQLPRLHAAATRQGIVSVDVSAALVNRQLELPRDLAHMDEAGNGVLTWELATFLMRQRLIPQAHWLDHTKVGPPPS